MEDQLILCSYLSKKKLIPSRTASKSWLSISHFNDHKSLIHHDCQTFRSRYPFDLDTVYSQHYIFFSLIVHTHVLYWKKGRRKRKEKKRIWTQTIHFVRWLESIKKSRQLIFLHYTHINVIQLIPIHKGKPMRVAHLVLLTCNDENSPTLMIK